MKGLTLFISFLLLGLSGCMASPESDSAKDDDDVPADRSRALETLVDREWTAQTLTPSMFVTDERIAEWIVPANTTRMWVNITLASEGVTVFASNGAYQGPGEAFRENYDQDAFSQGEAFFVVDGPPSGDWYALYRHATQEPNSNAQGYIVVQIEL